MKILVMGGTRFVGRPLVARLQAQGHELTLFTRGKNPSPPAWNTCVVIAAAMKASARCRAAASM